MGYEGQPTLIYFHHDTDNNHLHIVTSRVNAEGKKINHNHERRRSQQVMNRIMRQDSQQDVNSILNDALGFSFLVCQPVQGYPRSEWLRMFREGRHA